MADLTGLGSLFDFGSEVMKRLWPDANEAEKAKMGLLLAQLDAEAKAQQAQLAVNQVEAGSSSIFTAGWRPFIGWVCGSGLFYQLLVRPLLIGFSGHDFPPLELDTLMTLLFGLLGLGAYRTAEKIKGVAR